MILEIKNLSIQFESSNGLIHAVNDLGLELHKGETLGLVGESGSGKSLTALSVMQLLQPAAKVSGKIIYAPENVNLINCNNTALNKIRGSRIAMIFQEPMTSLNPVFRCGAQVVEAIRQHRSLSPVEAKKLAYSLFEKVKLRDPVRIFRSYPHQLSGGQKQRVMIAMALSGKPDILLADEPTTALDVTVQKSILQLLRELKEQENLSMIFISHDLGVIAEIADRVAVMAHGTIVETGTVHQVLENPQHPYTKGLLACRPSIQQKVHRLPTINDFMQNSAFSVRVVSRKQTENRRKDIYSRSPVLEVRDLTVRYPEQKYFWGGARQWNNAVDSVSFEVFPGEIFGLAGESGCGKTTLGKVIHRILPAQEGAIWFRKLNLETLPESEWLSIRREIQMVFQDPYSSLNPRMLIGDAILEPLNFYKLYGSDRQRKDKVMELLEVVGLEPEHARRFPGAFSGGQRQRICLARALALQPKLLVCDEIVSALDVSVQATILNLLLDLQEKFGLTLIFISHDLSVISQMCDRVMVMNSGKIEAIGHPEVLFEKPDNAFVRRLIDSIPGNKADF